MGDLRLARAGWRLRAVVAVVAGFAAAASVQARVTRIVIDATAAITTSPPTSSSPAGHSASSIPPIRTTAHHRHRASARTRSGDGQDHVHRQLRAAQAEGHDDRERRHVARRPESRRRRRLSGRLVRGQRRAAAERVAGRQRRRHGGPRQRHLHAYRAARARPFQHHYVQDAGADRRDGPGHRPHRQPQRPGGGAAQRDGQPDPVFPGGPRATIAATC